MRYKILPAASTFFMGAGASYGVYKYIQWQQHQNLKALLLKTSPFYAITQDKVEPMIIERIIDGDMSNGTQLRIGICKTPEINKENPLCNQCMKIGDTVLRLNNFTENDKSLIYNFDSAAQLVISKGDNNEIYYNVKTLEYDITKKIDPIIHKNYKAIGMNSIELDKIANILIN
jgi:hypothetical protein